MLTPVIDTDLTDIQEKLQPSYGYGLDTEKDRIRGMVDQLQALQQDVLVVLATEQGVHPIYGKEYGLKMIDLVGKPYHYVANELQRRIGDALLSDNRIKSVHSFDSQPVGDQLRMSFVIDSIYGSFIAAKEVQR